MTAIDSIKLSQKRVAIVLLNWNGRSLFEQFLPKLLKYTPEELADIIIADNASTDDSVIYLQSHYPSIRLILLDKNYGFAEGYNRALENLNYPFYLLLNTDVEVTSDWLQPLLSQMDTDPETAVCQPKIGSFRKPDYFEQAGAAGGYIDYLGYPFCRGRVMHILEKDHAQYDTQRSIFWATGACFMIRSEVYKEAGGLDNRFFAHMEEIDLCWRLRSRGKKIVCIPQSKVYHYGGGTLTYDNPFKTYLNFRNNLLMLYKNLPEKELHKVLYIRFGLDFIASLRFLLTGDFRNFRAVLKARKDYFQMKKTMLKDRMENLSKMQSSPIPERINQSMLFAFYLQGKKHFDGTAFFK